MKETTRIALDAMLDCDWKTMEANSSPEFEIAWYLMGYQDDNETEEEWGMFWPIIREIRRHESDHYIRTMAKELSNNPDKRRELNTRVKARFDEEQTKPKEEWVQTPEANLLRAIYYGEDDAS